jgi:hypothetical protein
MQFKQWRAMYVGLHILALLAVAAGPAAGAEPEAVWKPLFDGTSLSGWKLTNFGGEGEVLVENGSIILDFGSSITGITYAREFPKTNYEIRLEAMRADGRDFFCGMTFPVADSHCSLIVGGWGGALVGLSSIDGKDASENETTKVMKFDNGRWYRFRVLVTPEKIKAWIDDELQIDQSIEGRKITTRYEVNLSKPLGFASYETKAALRKIEYRLIQAGKDK